MHSNKYIFGYSIILVVLVATLLSLASLGLKPFQEENIRIEKMQNILAAANIETTAANVEALYDKYIVKELIVDLNGNVLSEYSKNVNSKKERAFDINLKIALKSINEFKLGKLKDKPKLPVYVFNKDNELFYIFPLLGQGLWGAIWGNVALKEDKNTIIGIQFDHESETPGLGAEINKNSFESSFIGKQIFDEKNNFISVNIVKNLTQKDLHSVDAISGGTITCNGTKDMLFNCLLNYKEFLKKK